MINKLKLKRYKVVPSMLWHRDDGQTASVYGVIPWSCAEERPRWTLIQTGWTVLNPYTDEIGECLMPFDTREEAEAYAASHLPSRFTFVGAPHP